MLNVQITELSPEAFQREALKLANNCIQKSMHYIPEADFEVYNIELDAYSINSFASQTHDTDAVYIVFADDNKVIRTLEFCTHEFMDLIIR